MNINCNVADTLALSPRMLAARQPTKIEVTPAEAAAPTAVSSARPLQTTGAAAPERVAPVGPFSQADVQQLTAHWGESGSKYDLDGNGTVNIDDLLIMLSHVQSEPQPTPPTMTPTSSTSAAEPAADPAATALTPDKTPEVAPPGAATDPAAPAGSAAPADPSVSASGAPSATPQGSDLEQLIAQWGEPNSRYDLDGNGVVDIDDLLLMLSSMPTPEAIKCSPATPGTDHDRTRTEALEAASEKAADIHSQEVQRRAKDLGAAGVKSLSTSLIDRLAAAGFEERPPTNLREVVDKLGLQPGDQRQVFAALTKRYPNGLGVSLRA